mmetsp:Transcript_49315/g.72063  ORF Transcript_49315/g.72063 Transcript_49315/m.72063 type:complete len:222 (-) Transcript_49315:264-929(-)
MPGPHPMERRPPPLMTSVRTITYAPKYLLPYRFQTEGSTTRPRVAGQCYHSRPADTPCSLHASGFPRIGSVAMAASIAPRQASDDMPGKQGTFGTFRAPDAFQHHDGACLSDAPRSRAAGFPARPGCSPSIPVPRRAPASPPNTILCGLPGSPRPGLLTTELMLGNALACASPSSTVLCGLLGSPRPGRLATELVLGNALACRPPRILARPEASLTLVAPA